MKERKLAGHLDAGAVEPVHQDHAAAILRRGYPPTLERYTVTRLERDVFEGEVERGWRKARILLVVVTEPIASRQAAQPVADDAEDRDTQQEDQSDEAASEPEHHESSCELKG